MVRIRTLLLPTAFLALCVAAGPATRPAIPDPAALREARSSFQRIYGAELERAQTKEDRDAWSKQLLEASNGSQAAPSFRYVLLTKAANLATSAGDVPVAFKAVDRIEAEWSVDGLGMKTDVLIKSIPMMRAPQERLDWLGDAEVIGDQAVADDRYAIAAELSEAASTVIAPIRTAALSTRLKARKDQLDELTAAYAALAPSLARLQTSPTDPAANLAVGKFQAFLKGDWQSGLSKIAIGSDPALADLAARDRAAAENPDDRVGLADAWWDLGEQQTGIARRNLRLRAGSWYQLPPSGLTGLTKMKVDHRLAQVASEGGEPPAVIPPAGTGKPDAVAVDNRTDAKETDDIIASVRKHYPDSVQDVRQFELVRYHNAAEFRGGAGEKEIAGSYAPSSREASGGGISLWGIYENWEPGRYLIVYRVRALRRIEKGDCCFLDVCVKGVTLASRKPKPQEMEPGTWDCIPIPAELDSEKELEFRLWPFGHLIALDRVYIFRVH